MGFALRGINGGQFQGGGEINSIQLTKAAITLDSRGKDYVMAVGLDSHTEASCTALLYVWIQRITDE